MSRSRRVVVEADGGARGNPGPAGWGVVVRDAETAEPLLERSGAIGTATNNVAEYAGLIAGLRAAAELGAGSVEVRMDSKLVIEQMAGRWKIKHPGLRPLAAQAAELVREFESVTWTWVARERNKEADRLANEAMDAGTGSAAGAGEAAPARVPRTGWDPPADPPTRLVLVRHGQTSRNVERRYSGRGDVPLTERGLAEAEAVAGRVAELLPRVAAVVSSPLRRCTTTAARIAAATGDPPVVADPDLIECDFGEWEGRTLAEVRQRWPEAYAGWLASTAAAPPGGESLRQIAERVRRAVSRLRESYPAAGVVVVSHVWPLKVMLRDALAAGDAFLHRLMVTSTGLSVIDSYPDGTVAVYSVNETAHLPAPPGQPVPATPASSSSPAAPSSPSSISMPSPAASE